MANGAGLLPIGGGARITDRRATESLFKRPSSFRSSEVAMEHPE
jgi:hypothetical protein